MTAVLKRLGQVTIVLFLVTVFTTLLFSLLPGDLAQVNIPYGSDAQRAALRTDLGLNKPLYVQYGRWLGHFVQGNFGSFYRQGNVTPVLDRVKATAPVSLELVFSAQVLALVFAIPLGIWTARRAGSLGDKLTNTTAYGLLAVPNFIFALLLAYVVGVKLRWLPVQGYVPPTRNLVEHIRSMALPAISLAVGQVAVYMRLLRTDLVATLQQDFILMAKSKGITERRVLWRHALRPSSLTLLTVAGLNVGALIGGAVITEVIFSLDGMGRLIFEAIGERQTVVIQSLVALFAIGYVLVNFMVDILYAVLDPRIRRA
ncbi:MAG: peptide/nickel transport system permease protein [Actinomycetota bacterium]|nr:peptide/nickel transport system permease protein [Actinomycetota bacterium]